MIETFNWWAIFVSTVLAFVLGGWRMKLFTIQAGYRVLYSIIMGAVLAAGSSRNT